MMLKPPMDLATFEAKAGQVADTLKAIGNARRLMLLCKLVEHGEMTVGDLARDVGLSQSACSQHLARMRDEGLVTLSLIHISEPTRQAESRMPSSA